MRCISKRSTVCSARAATCSITARFTDELQGFSMASIRERFLGR